MADRYSISSPFRDQAIATLIEAANEPRSMCRVQGDGKNDFG
jgi:hypothetical protein